MSDDIADLIVHLARLAQMPPPSEGGSPRPTLTAAQWTALRYFARANRFSRTPSAFSDFHATTRGTASQTVKSLVALGLLAKSPDPGDARQIVINVTPAGQDMLRHDPLAALRDTLGRLTAADRVALSRIVGLALADLAHQRGAPVFGTCADCTHCDERAAQAYCHCTQSLLTMPDMAAFCVDFQPSTARS